MASIYSKLDKIIKDLEEEKEKLKKGGKKAVKDIYGGAQGAALIAKDIFSGKHGEKVAEEDYLERKRSMSGSGGGAASRMEEPTQETISVQQPDLYGGLISGVSPAGAAKYMGTQGRSDVADWAGIYENIEKSGMLPWQKAEASAGVSGALEEEIGRGRETQQRMEKKEEIKEQKEAINKAKTWLNSGTQAIMSGNAKSINKIFKEMTPEGVPSMKVKRFSENGVVVQMGEDQEMAINIPDFMALFEQTVQYAAPSWGMQNFKPNKKTSKDSESQKIKSHTDLHKAAVEAANEQSFDTPEEKNRYIEDFKRNVLRSAGVEKQGAAFRIKEAPEDLLTKAKSFSNKKEFNEWYKSLTPEQRQSLIQRSS